MIRIRKKIPLVCSCLCRFNGSCIGSYPAEKEHESRITFIAATLQIESNCNEKPHTEKQNRYGAFALFSEDLTKLGAKIYATYYTTRKDNEWARANPDEVQQCYIMTGFYTATEDTLEIPWMKGLAKDLSQLNRKDCQSFGRNENGKGIGKSHAGSPKCLEVWRCSPSRRRNGWRFYSSGLPVPLGNRLNV